MIPKHAMQMSLFSAGFIKNAKSFGLLGDDIQFWEGGYASASFPQ